MKSIIRAFSLKAFIQGGQTQLHRLRMLSQVTKIAWKICLVVFIVSFIFLSYRDINYENIWLLICYLKAFLRAKITFLPDDLFSTCTLDFYDQSIKISKKISDQTLLNSSLIRKVIDYNLDMILKDLLKSLFLSFLSAILIIIFWIKKGNDKEKTKVLEGSFEVSNKVLTKQLKKDNKSSDFSLAGIPLLKDAQFQHMLITGTTGSGKTTCLMELLRQIRDCGQRAVIVDTTFEIYKKFYQEGDFLLNPLEQNSQKWNLWQECENEYHLQNFAEGLIPQNSFDPFWTNGARALFIQTTLLLKDYSSYEKLLDIALKFPLKDVEELFNQTDVASLMSKESEKTALSVRSTLMQYLSGFRYLSDDNPCFTFKNYLQNQDNNSWLFLACKPDQRAILKSLFSAWLTCISRSLMANGTDQKPTWIIIDELPSLNKIPELSSILAEIRKYKGCLVLGIQNFSQLEEIYGKNVANTINSLTGTKVIFRSGDMETAKRMSSFLGEQEIIEQNESISFGSNQMRDGINLNDHKRIKNTITPTKLLQLNDLEAYLKLPSNYPVTKLRFGREDELIIC